MALCAVAAASAQADSAFYERSSVSLITIYPGPDVYEVYGHTMLMLSTPSGDVAFNYGIFNFNEPNFMLRFMLGKATYCVDAMPAKYILYGNSGRKVVRQDLDFTPDQVAQIHQFLLWNMQEENRYYRYNFARDNCSTRVRDIIQKAAGKSLAYKKKSHGVTYRQLFDKYNDHYPWQKLGINMILGKDIDFRLSLDEEMFIPMAMMQALQTATIERDGKTLPLVKAATVLQQGSENGNIAAPTPFWMRPLFVFGALLGIVICLSWQEYRSRKFYRWLDFIMFFGLASAGLIVSFLFFLSNHYATSPNLNILVVNPLLYIIAALSIIPKADKWLRRSHQAFLLLFICWAWAQVFSSQIIHLEMHLLILSCAIRSATRTIHGARR